MTTEYNPRDLTQEAAGGRKAVPLPPVDAWHGDHKDAGWSTQVHDMDGNPVPSPLNSPDRSARSATHAASPNRYRVTVRGTDIELRGVIDGYPTLRAFSHDVKAAGLVIASPLPTGQLVPHESWAMADDLIREALDKLENLIDFWDGLPLAKDLVAIRSDLNNALELTKDA